MIFRFFPSRQSCRALLLAVSMVAFAACAPTAEEVEVDEQEVLATIERYTELLGQAYATGNLQPMLEVAAQKEVATVANLVEQYAVQGVVVKPTPTEVTLEDVTVWSANNAYATTVELWDLRKYVAGTDRLLSEALAQSHRVKYQLKRRDEGWQVLYREVQSLE